ncbi:MAG: hydrogenase maturation nickel metallochaperone HypA [Candidatus Omnitrophica bacterium]|nr:hydrogenase maturation nickel metallochaperone HypA [Candidatus Omnitrophota bacterium]MCM8790182.1 hydrogenase maturation nickel metallochaperone HypA [Candidatus Omnitrophota bacterium]
MHDFKFCQEILAALTEKSKKSGKAIKIKSVRVALSPVSHVTPKTLEETFRTMAKNTPFSTVKLYVSPLKLGIKCEACKKGFMVERPTFICPECHSPSLNIIYQKEFAIDSIECQKKLKKPAKTKSKKRR